MLENREYNRSHRRRSGSVGTGLSVDKKRRGYLKMARRRGCYGDEGSGSDLESDEEGGVESIDLMDMPRSIESAEDSEVICDDRAGDEIAEIEPGVDVDLLLESVTVQDSLADPFEVSLSDFANLLELEELQNIPVEALSSDTDDVSPYDSVALTQEPDITHAELEPSDAIIELDQIPQTPSEDLLGRNFLPGKKEPGQEESLAYIPLNLKIPAHARARSTRRSLESIGPILDRKAKLPLGPADAPRNK